MIQNIPTYIVGMCKVYCAVNQIKHCSKEQTNEKNLPQKVVKSQNKGNL